jgi:uncharacterized paraquat-inducible protein A
MKTTDLITAIRDLAKVSPPISCIGCGQRHRCGTNGCVILMEAAAWITAAIIDLEGSRSCRTCRYRRLQSSEKPCTRCRPAIFSEWEWHGPQEEETKHGNQ